MRIGMRQIRARGQHSAFEQFLDDSRIGFSFFASLRENVQASEKGEVVPIAAVLKDVVGDLQPVPNADKVELVGAN